ncbi:MAG: hypothetical protein K0Q55_3449 [Verrucomicrobia bacterium]|nr:hypothetical protein [Verrucomicrobiota bacterium]
MLTSRTGAAVNKLLICPSDMDRQQKSFSQERLKGNQETSYFISLNEATASQDVVAMGDRNLSPGEGQPLYSSANGKPVTVATNITVWGTSKNNKFHVETGGNLLFTDGHVEAIEKLPATLTGAVKAGGTNADRFMFPQ